MNLNKKEREQKRIIQLVNERNELWTAKSNTPSLLLPAPIRRGWKKFFVLRDDITRRADANNFRRILAHINTTIYSRRKDFKTKSGKKLVDRDHSLKVIEATNWDKIGLPESFKKYFWLCSGCQVKDGSFRRLSHRAAYHFGPTYYFVPRIAPHFLTHYTVPDSALESRLAEINAEMENRQGWAKYAKMKGWRHNFEAGYDDTILFIKDRVADTDMRHELIATASYWRRLHEAVAMRCAEEEQYYEQQQQEPPPE